MRGLGVTRSLVLVGWVAGLAAGCSSSDEAGPKPGPASSTEPAAPATTLAEQIVVDEVAV